MSKQYTPSFWRTHLLHLAGMPVCVGPGAWFPTVVVAECVDDWGGVEQTYWPVFGSNLQAIGAGIVVVGLELDNGVDGPFATQT